MKLIGNCNCCGKFVAVEVKAGDAVDNLVFCDSCIEKYALWDYREKHCGFYEDADDCAD